MRTGSGTLKVQLFLLMMVTGVGCSGALNKDLVNAAHRGDVPEIKALIQRGANSGAVAVDGWTPLTMAAREGHLEAVDALLGSGVNIDAPEGGGNTALFWAAFYDHRDVIRLLLSSLS